MGHELLMFVVIRIGIPDSLPCLPSGQVVTDSRPGRTLATTLGFGSFYQCNGLQMAREEVWWGALPVVGRVGLTRTMHQTLNRQLFWLRVCLSFGGCILYGITAQGNPFWQYNLGIRVCKSWLLCHISRIAGYLSCAWQAVDPLW